MPESCDDGPLNGTAQSLCSKQCYWAGITGFLPTNPVPLDMSPKRAVSVLAAGTGHWGIAFTDFDDQGVHVIWQAAYATPIIAFKVASAPVALGVTPGQPTLPLWIEGPTAGDPALHMYYADASGSGPSAIHEVPYPFPDGTRPQLYASLRSLVIVDHSRNPPHDLLVAAWAGPMDFPTYASPVTLRLPAPGQVFGAGVEVEGSDYITDATLQAAIQRITLFFDDTLAFVTIEVHEPDPDVTGASPPYSVAEFARGTFPYRVTSARGWWKGAYTCFADVRTKLSHYAALSHPTPVLVLADTGDLYAWQPSATPNGEAALPVFAHIAPGSLLVDNNSVLEGTNAFGPDKGIAWVAEPDGTSVYLADGDCTDATAPALQPQRFPLTPPWTTATSVITDWGSPDPSGFIVDDKFWAYP